MSQIVVSVTQGDSKNGSSASNLGLIRTIVEKSITPFEKMSSQYIYSEHLDPVRTAVYMQHWRHNLSPKGGRERLDRFMSFSKLAEADIQKMLAPVSLQPSASLPDWADVLGDVLAEYASSEPSDMSGTTQEPIAFEEFLHPFVRVFEGRLIQGAGTANYNLSVRAYTQVKRFLLSQLSGLACTVLMPAFEAYLKRQLEEVGVTSKPTDLSDDYYYRLFVKDMWQDHVEGFFLKYPVLARVLANALHQHVEAFARFLRRLEADMPAIIAHFDLTVNPGEVERLSLGISDPHKGGEGVMIVEFERGWKLVYKPRCMKIGVAYNALCEWINERIDPQLKVLNMLLGDGYGWIEYAPHVPCKDRAAVERYYQRAGMLLGITYLLDSTDFHSENVIASGEHPILVDLETLLQPELRVDQSAMDEEQRAWYSLHQDSVLRASLLPMLHRSANFPDDSVCGFGGTNASTSTITVKELISINTDGMRVEKRKKPYEIRKNLPHLDGEIQRIPVYQSAFEAGFERVYELFVRERETLLSSDGPLSHFQHLAVRFLFRSTAVYDAIKRNTLTSKYLQDATLFGLRLELMARAFVGNSTRPAYWCILSDERRAMLVQDIPCFEFYSDEEDLLLANGHRVSNYFLKSCLDYIKEKLSRFGSEDKAQQTHIIRRALKGEFS